MQEKIQFTKTSDTIWRSGIKGKYILCLKKYPSHVETAVLLSNEKKKAYHVKIEIKM